MYTEEGVNFPFSHHMQAFWRERLSALAMPSAQFVKAYGADFTLGIRLNARKEIAESEIRGPTVFRRTKDVEYALFLPYDVVMSAEDKCRAAVCLIVSGIQRIADLAQVELVGFESEKDSLIKQTCCNPLMLLEPWSDRAPS